MNAWNKVDVMMNSSIWICHFDSSAIFYLPWCWCSAHEESCCPFDLKRNFEVGICHSNYSIVISSILTNGVSIIPDYWFRLMRLQGILSLYFKTWLYLRMSVSADST